MNSVTCKICKKTKNSNSAINSEVVTPTTSALIKEQNENWGEGDLICFDCLNSFRAEQVRRLLKDEKGRLSGAEREVIDSIKSEDLITENPVKEFEGHLKLGDRVADKVAEFGGSWKFIISFVFFLSMWIVFNTIQLLGQPIDPFPYILLNLVLSCVTALQAPIIMMSQNRQAEKDRVKAELEYQVNLKAEVQTRIILKRLDQFMNQQWKKFIEIQEIQNEMVKDRKK